VIQFELLKPRLLAAGVLFLFFFSLALLGAARAFGYFGFTPLLQGQSSLFVPALRLLDLVLSGVAIATITPVFFKDLQYEHLGWCLSGIIGAIACIAIVTRKLPRTPWLCAALTLAAYAGLGMALWKSDRIFQINTGWFAGVGLLFAWVRAHTEDVKKLRQPWPEYAFINLVSTISAFALLVYPNVKFGYGGGMPAPLTVQFQGASPIDQRDRLKAWYVDETDKGYYLLLNENDKKAIFLPRDRISLVYFGAEEPAPPSSGAQASKPGADATTKH
jgi:hypothetical protein